MNVNKKDRLDMIQLGFNPLLEADIQRFFAGQPPSQDRSKLYEGETANLGQANMSIRDMPISDYTELKIGQEITINPEDDVIEKPIQPNTRNTTSQNNYSHQNIRKTRQVITEDDDGFGLPPKRTVTNPTISKEQLQAKGLADGQEYLRLFVNVLNTNQPKARIDLLNKLNMIIQFMSKLDQNSKVYYNTGLAKKEKSLLSRFE